MLWAWNRLKAALDKRLSIFILQELDDLHIPTALVCSLFNDWCCACRADGLLRLYWVLLVDYLRLFDNFLQTLSTMSAPTLVENQRGSELDRFKFLFLPLLVFCIKLFLRGNRVEGVVAVVAK